MKSFAVAAIMILCEQLVIVAWSCATGLQLLAKTPASVIKYDGGGGAASMILWKYNSLIDKWLNKSY